MFDLGDRIILFFAGRALVGAGLIAAIVCLIVGADVGLLVSIGVLAIGAAMALEGA